MESTWLGKVVQVARQLAVVAVAANYGYSEQTTDLRGHVKHEAIRSELAVQMPTTVLHLPSAPYWKGFCLHR